MHSCSPLPGSDASGWSTKSPLLPGEEICPAPGQGALAIQVRTADQEQSICKQLNHEPTAQAVACERAVLSELGGGCQLPVAAFAKRTEDGSLTAVAGVFAPDGSRAIHAEGTGKPEDAVLLGRNLAAQLIAQGARTLLSVPAL